MRGTVALQPERYLRVLNAPVESDSVMATESSPQVPTPLVVAAQSRIDSLPDGTVNSAPMFDAARQGNTALLLQAVDKGLSVDLTDDKDPNRLNYLGQSMIAAAVSKSQDNVVRILAEAGADPRIGKSTALEAAHIFGRKELMEVLGAKQGDIGSDVPTPPSARPEK
ncbi:hypothetical protein EDD22DRAFT_954039 [Suillus occidentalis]|nr:hypothetical protein EDD22DRAFT_954039 [Suillus occidentalis]